MQLSKSKPLSWYTEIFTSGYFRTHTFSTLFIYAIFVIILIALINEIRTFEILYFGKFILKVVFSILIIYLIKLFFEKFNI